MSQTSIDTRPNEEALAALLIFAILGVGSLFTVARTVGNHLLGSAVKAKQPGSGFGPEPRMKKEQLRLKANRDDSSHVQNDYSSNRNQKGSSKFQHLQAKSQPSQPLTPSAHGDRDTSYEEGLNDIRAWEAYTISRIQRETARRLDRLLSADDQGENRKASISAILDLESATMGRFKQEKARRLKRLSSVDDDEQIIIIQDDKGREAVHAWEPAAKRRVARDNGVKAVRDWEQAKMERLGGDGKDGKERRADIEDDKWVIY